MALREKTILFLSSGGLVGYIPFAPGTFGSLLGLPLCFMLAKINIRVALVLLLLFVGLAVWICDSARRILGKEDPGCIVLDEISGMMVALAGVPLTIATSAAGFILFRLFDIMKPFPIRTVEKRFGGGLGIVLDDVVAGIFTNLILRAFFFLWE